ncbi:MAG: hypothetical protein KDH96_08915, partial [Candidatus Riesia sp.]|nr:hypothetical protein [Candidatus Riesia sp.]
MVNGVVKTKIGLISMLNAEWLGVTNVSTKMKIGSGTTTPSVGDTALENNLIIEQGTTIFDCDSALTGSSGGSNSTDNTTTYKEGGDNADTTSQNLITNNSSATKQWLKTGLSFDRTHTYGLWFYIADQTTLDYFLNFLTSLEIRLESDVSNYYS